MKDKTHFVTPNTQPIVELDCTKAFNNLTTKEKLYAHHYSKACWNTGLIILVQTSPESPLIFALLHRIFKEEPSIEDFKQIVLTAGISEDDFTAFLAYCVGFASKTGNYKGRGNSKIVPNLDKEIFEKILKLTKSYSKNALKIDTLWNRIKEPMFSLHEKNCNLGLRPNGITTYFSSNCSEEDAVIITDWLKYKKIEEYNNTRAFKTILNGKTIYEIKYASVECSDKVGITVSDEEYKNCIFRVTRGDYSKILKLVNTELANALKYAANENQMKMIEFFIKSYIEGSIKDHKEGTRYFIKDKAPSVENYMGLAAPYRDPAGQRGEFMTFVAIVDKEISSKFGILVENAEKFVKTLPWGKDYEKNSYLRPDFTSLEVLTFSSSDIPIGILMPIYSDILQNEGFKNVSLGNVVRTLNVIDSYQFLSEDDKLLMKEYKLKALEVQVGLHELLGHGTGKLFIREENGEFNFDKENVKDPLTGSTITKWYEPGESYYTKFTTISASYEECRAETVGLYLCLNREVQSIFGYTAESEIENIIYVNWLSLIWAGFAQSMEFYNGETKIWQQAHAQARFIIMKMLLETAEGLISIEETENGKNLLLKVNREKIETEGRKAIRNFLLKLQVFKSTGDSEAAVKLYDYYSKIEDNENGYRWESWRHIVLAHIKPKLIHVQSNTEITKDNCVILKRYQPDLMGYLRSWIDRYENTEIYDILDDIWENQQKHFSKSDEL